MESPQPEDNALDARLQSAQRPATRRRWPWVAASVFLFLVLIIMLLPTLLGSSIGRPLLVGYINQQIDGRIEIKDCSLGWLSGMQINGLVGFDESGRQILQAVRVNTGLTFMNALRGRYRLGDVQADGLDILVSREPDGSINWDELIRSDSSWNQAAKSLTGQFSVENGSSTYEDRFDPTQPPVYLRSIAGKFQIQRPGGAITDAFFARAQIGSLAGGTAQSSGLLTSGPDGALHFSQTLTTHGMDAAIVSRRLGPGWRVIRTTQDEAVFQFGVQGNAMTLPTSVPATRPQR